MAIMEKKEKVIFVIGSTGTGKSKLAIDIADEVPAEVINSDKIQVYRGLPVVTNKVTEDEARGVAHHLIGVVDPDRDFTADEFRRSAMHHVRSVIARGNVPIVAGGSNSFVEELVEGNDGEFKTKYSCCFLWVHVSLVVLFPHLARRIDKMVEAGLVEEVLEAFDPDVDDYSRGVRRAIGVPELHGYFREAAAVAGDKDAEVMLDKAIELMKVNTCKLAECQVAKIHRLMTLPGWKVHRLDATKVLERDTGGESEKAWEEFVRLPALQLVSKFLAAEEEVDRGRSTASLIDDK